ncbi:MAG: hypothetical protein MR630_05510 [Selenomonas sp.]|uniref:hypothetical protein n=1 Tax=Selenomonas sp. TaxID=2053611 RepID=UPI0025E8E85A|nr:hypothetical protein [Selenomonas sp.]MCI6099432.1 hypothetical protein [Selenomonas sp.]MCI6232050.1 hypothetical protein [Selenomonas sp.]
MVRQNLLFTEQEINLLRSWKGQRLVSIGCDKKPYSHLRLTAWFAAILQIEATPFYLCNFTEPMDYYGAVDDVARMTLATRRDAIIDDKKDWWQTIHVNRTIQDIHLVQEHQELFENGEQTYDVYVTRGILLDFWRLEISFEKAVWFSEDIDIAIGHDVLKTFAPIKDFEEDWEDGCVGKCSRELVQV